MNGLYLHGAHDVRYETLPDPKLTDPSQVLVRTIGCSICGTDLNYYKNHGQTAHQCGFAIGHEAIGEVMEVGSAVRTLKAGDEVMVPGALGCGQCSACLRRDTLSCQNNDGIQCYGIGMGYAGLQAEAFVVPWADTNTLKIPDGISHDQALMLTDVVATAWLGVHNAEVRPGDTVVVVGLGPIGLACVEIALAFGASRVIGVGRSREDRMQAARDMGAITARTDEAIETIRDLTKGLMAQGVIETAGTEAALLRAMDAARRNGTVSSIGAYSVPQFPFPMLLALTRNITFRPALCSPMQFWDQSIPLVRDGVLHPERLITAHVSLSDGPGIYRQMADGASGVLKTVLRP